MMMKEKKKTKKTKKKKKKKNKKKKKKKKKSWYLGVKDGSFFTIQGSSTGTELHFAAAWKGPY